MDFTGIVFERQEAQLATLEAEVIDDYLICEIKVGSTLIIKFPLPSGSDLNEVALRAGNIINQTMLVANPVRVQVEPVV